MEKHFYGTSLSYPKERGKNFVYLNIDTVYCVSEEIKPRNVFCIAAKTTKKYQKILSKLFSQITLEESNIGDAFQFAQIMNYEDFFHFAFKYGKNMNVIPIYYDKDDKSIQKFIDNIIPFNPMFQELRLIVLKIDYTKEDYNVHVINSLNNTPKKELVDQIMSRKNIEWEQKWERIVSENSEYFNKN